MCLSFGRSFIPANGSTMSTQQRITEPVVDPACESLRIKAQKGDHPRYRLMPSSFSKPRASASDQLLAVIELSYPDSASQSFFKEWVSNRELCLQSPREDCRSQHHRIVATHALGVAARMLQCEGQINPLIRVPHACDWKDRHHLFRPQQRVIVIHLDDPQTHRVVAGNAGLL